MTEYTIADVSPGDRVTLEHDNTKYPVEAEAFIREGQTFLELKYASFSLSVPWMLARGWRITAVVKPEPELPTEPGYYVDKEGDPWQLKPEDDSHEARWFCGTEKQPEGVTENFAPFTRLAPVPETAKAVLDRIDEGAEVTVGGFDAIYSIPDWQLNSIGREFGVPALTRQGDEK